MRYAAFAIFALIPVCALAVTPAPKLPAEMIYKGKPIDANCLAKFNLAEDTPTKDIDIRYCPDVAGDAPVNGMAPPFEHYDYLGKQEGKLVLQTMESGGGSGRFDNVVLLTRSKNALHLVQVIRGGDRCNGGIDNVTIDGKHLVIERDVTPADLLALPGVNPHGLKPYDDLESGANNCLGALRMRIDPVKRNHDTLLGFVPGEWEQKSMDEQLAKSQPYQACFNSLMNGVPAQDFWTAGQLREFMMHFNRSCVEKKV